MEKEIKVTFKIAEVEVTKFQIKSDPSLLKRDGELVTNFIFEISTTMGISLEEKRIRWIINSKIFLDPEKTKFQGEIETIIFFEIVNFDEIVKKNPNNKIEINDEVLKILMQIALDTTRGILIAKTADTPLRKAYLPFLSPSKFISEMKKKKV